MGGGGGLADKLFPSTAAGINTQCEELKEKALRWCLSAPSTPSQRRSFALLSSLVSLLSAPASDAATLTRFCANSGIIFGAGELEEDKTMKRDRATKTSLIKRNPVIRVYVWVFGE